MQAGASRFMSVWPGALLATTLWLLATTGFGWYVRHFANYNIFYGSMDRYCASDLDVSDLRASHWLAANTTPSESEIGVAIPAFPPLY